MLALREGTGFLQGKEVSLCLAKVAFDWDGNLSIPSFQWKHDIRKETIISSLRKSLRESPTYNVAY
jgi:hypothetical protein